MKRILPDLTPDNLRALYWEKHLDTPAIARLLRCSQGTIYNRMVKYEIPRRSPKKPIPRDELEHLYIQQRLSSRKIAKIYGCAYSHVDDYIHHYGFPVRSLADAHIITFRAGFSGNLLEKAYLIGFRIGDLRVRRMYKHSETLLVDCGSTHLAQIGLIKNLFDKYGRVWISRRFDKGKIQIECGVDSSFNFLLRKYRYFPSWSLSQDNLALSIFAGFIDAEGCFYVSRSLKRGKFELGNYQLSLLIQIRRWLNKRDINSKIYAGHKRGYKDKNGYVRNGDYWNLNVYRKKDLYVFTTLIYPYLRHREKRKDARLLLHSLHYFP